MSDFFKIIKEEVTMSANEFGVLFIGCASCFRRGVSNFWNRKTKESVEVTNPCETTAFIGYCPSCMKEIVVESIVNNWP